MNFAIFCYLNFTEFIFARSLGDQATSNRNVLTPTQDTKREKGENHTMRIKDTKTEEKQYKERNKEKSGKEQVERK